MNILVFDIETIPDVASGRKLNKLDVKMSDSDVADFMFAQQMEKKNTEFLPIHLHKVAAISAVMVRGNDVRVWSLADEDSTEEEIVKRFFAGVEKYTPTLVSWNGAGFDLPVLHYRAMVHKIAAPRYWEMGEFDQTFKWNNYISRYHMRHIDIMDLVALYQVRAFAPLDDIASILGFPGKMGESGSKVWDYFKEGKIKAIRDYCETDVLNTYLVYLRFELMRGRITNNDYDKHCNKLKEYLKSEQKSHFDEFLAAWLD